MKKRFYKKFVYLVLYVGALSICRYASYSDITYLKLGHALSVDHPMYQGMEYMANAVREKSQGKLQVEIFPSQQLGSERQCLDLLQDGSVAMIKVSAEVLENFAAKSKVRSLSYIYKDKAYVYRVQGGEIAREMVKQGEHYWLRGLAYFKAGQYGSIQSRELTPTAAEGLSFAHPQQISEVCKDQFTSIPDLLMISTVAWDGLEKNEQLWLQEAADEAVEYQQQLWQEATSYVCPTSGKHKVSRL